MRNRLATKTKKFYKNSKLLIKEIQTKIKSKTPFIKNHAIITSFKSL